MKRELVWGNGEKEIDRKEYTDFGSMLASALWKVIAPINNGNPFEWCRYYRDGILVHTYTAADYQLPHR